jgi:hypothetical protein
MSPSSDIVGPSPVTSNGTATTEIDDEAADNAEEENGQVRRSVGRSGECEGPCQLADSAQLMMLRTNIPDHIRRPVSEEVVSVIHAPPSFQNWVWLISHVPEHDCGANPSTLSAVERCGLEIQFGKRHQRGEHERQ